MKQLYLSLSLFLLASAPNAAANVRFMPESRMASGKWVKVGVDRSGVFEISHSALLSMGFSNPERVAILGRGGRQLDMNFTDASGATLYSDQLTPVASIHSMDKMYFYAEGPDEFYIETHQADVADGYFSRKNRNIYSSTGYYFLTDTYEPTQMECLEPGDNPSPASEINYGYGMVSHEVDLLQNCTDTGQLFYGEEISGNNPRLSWPVFLPDALPGSQGTMECAYYLDHLTTGSWKFGLAEDSDTPNYRIDLLASSAMRSVTPKYTSVNVPGENANVFVEVNIGCRPQVANLDYWVLSYRRGIPSLKGSDGTRINQDMVAFPNMTRSQECSIRIPEGSGYMAFDVTDPSRPVNLKVWPDGKDGMARVRYEMTQTQPPVVVVFDPLMPQHQIKGFECGYSAITNQNLHRKAAEGADMVIICIPQLYDTARRLAMIHEKHDGITTLVATTEECYNEFSEGLPDPMAYRALVKATYSSQRPCRNLLLMGPLYADFRGVVNEKQQQEGIIAYQANTLMQDKGTPNANDIYGMMADYIELAALQSNQMEVGVGLLPLRSPGEAEIILEKIERYLKGENMEYYLNAFSHVGGCGNLHTHDIQAIQQSYRTDRLSDYSIICSNIPVDAYGYRPAQQKFFNNLDRGCMMVTYFGHGSGKMLNLEGDFFLAADVYRLRNKYLPFIGFAGCSLSDVDRGTRGMGESIVLSTKYGAIGTLLATRETWSGENGLLFETFYNNLFRNGNRETSPYHESPLTIGEVLARTKSQTNNNNELAYQLICDPAIVLPVTLRRICFQMSEPELTAGQRINVKGYVADASGSGEIDHDFNGSVVLRLMQPARTFISPDICTGDETELRVPETDVQLGMATARVHNGEFNADIAVPVSARQFAGQPGRIHACVYDPSVRIAGGGLLSGIYAASTDDTPGDRDNYPPVIEHFSFDEANAELSIRVSDDVALGYSTDALAPSFRLMIDGRDYSAGTHAIPMADPDCEAYTRLIPLPNLSEGYHTAKVTVYDAAGNHATAETSFSYLPSRPKFSIRLSETAIDMHATITAVGESPASAEIVILSPEGESVARLPFANGECIWDVTDSRGLRVSPGVYKAYLLETGDGQNKSHSATICLPVIGQ